jgi:hypothetical protein
LLKSFSSELWATIGAQFFRDAISDKKVAEYVLESPMIDFVCFECVDAKPAAESIDNREI